MQYERFKYKTLKIQLCKIMFSALYTYYLFIVLRKGLVPE